jgi:Zn-dependent protease
VWQLDGGRAFRALPRRDRWLAVLVIAIMWLATGSGLLLLTLLVCATYAAAFGRAPEDEDRMMTLLFAGLVVTLSLLGKIPVAITGVAGP